MFSRKNIISAVEIGSSKICVLMGSIDDSGGVKIIGHGERPSEGSVVKGEIASMEKLTDIVFDAIHAAENSSSESIDPANTFVSVTGPHVRGVKSRGSVIINSPDRKVTPDKMAEANEMAAHVMIPPDCVIINTLGGNFILDDVRQMPNPENQIASKLELSSFVISANANCVSSFKDPLREFGCEEPIPVYSGLASSISVLTDDEMKHGVLLLDIGAGTCDYLLFSESCGAACGCVPVGTEHIANDLSIGLGLNISYCRKILAESIWHKLKLDGVGQLSIEGSSERRKIPINSIDKIIEMRIKELFGIVQKVLAADGLLNCINRGVVITGGGALIPGINSIANTQFDCLVRTGTPPNLIGAVSTLKSPKYSNATGLIAAGDNIRKMRKDSGGGFVRKMDRFFQHAWRKLRRGAKDAIPI